MPTVEVVVWDPKYCKESKMGHVSLNVRDPDSSDVYISWWPDNEEFGKVKGYILPITAYSGRTFDDDCKDEKKQPDYRIAIPGDSFETPGLDITKLLAAWMSFNNGKNKWILRSDSCAGVSIKLLKAAYNGTFLPHYFERVISWTPMAVKEVAERLVSEYAVRHLTIKQEAEFDRSWMGDYDNLVINW